MTTESEQPERIDSILDRAMAEWQRADMNPEDPFSQGYNAEPIQHRAGEATALSMDVVEHDWYECPRCGEEMHLAPWRHDGPDRDLRCSHCGYHYVD